MRLVMTYWKGRIYAQINFGGVEVMLLVVEIKFLMWNTQATYPFSYRARDCIREWYVIVSAFENKWESETTLLPIVYFWYRPIKLCSIN